MQTSDITSLPWQGNYNSDFKLFQQIDQFIRVSEDREVQKQALTDMVLYGMGIKQETTDAILDEYIEEGVVL